MFKIEIGVFERLGLYHKTERQTDRFRDVVITKQYIAAISATHKNLLHFFEPQYARCMAVANELAITTGYAVVMAI